MALNLRAVLSDRCNYQCVFCSRDFNRAVHQDLPAGFLDVCMKSFAALGGQKFTCTGGEPLIYPQLLSLLRTAKSLGLTTSITTNGSLLPRQSSEFFTLVDALNISIPSFNPEEYINLTGASSLEAVKTSALDAASLGIKVKINCVYSQGRELMIREMVNYFAPHGIIIKLMNDMLARGDYYAAFMEYASRFRKSPDVEVECALNPGYTFCQDCTIPRNSSCPSCRSLWVYPDGRITLCPFDETGSYLRASHDTIREHMKELMIYDRQENYNRAVHENT